MRVLSTFFAGGYALDILPGETPAFFVQIPRILFLTNEGYVITLKCEKIGRFLIGTLLAVTG